MNNKNLHIVNLIMANIGLIIQVNQNFADTQSFSLRRYVPFEYVNKLYKLLAQHHAQTENPSLILLRILGEEVTTNG